MNKDKQRAMRPTAPDKFDATWMRMLARAKFAHHRIAALFDTTEARVKAVVEGRNRRGVPDVALVLAENAKILSVSVRHNIKDSWERLYVAPKPKRRR